MAQPRVSIVIPCFNAAQYVREAIQSALDQTYPDVEVVVIDDGSTDDSLDIIHSFGDRIRWETGPKRGASAARNRGIELAKGELIQFLDADDRLRREKIQRSLHPLVVDQADLVYSDGAVIPPAPRGTQNRFVVSDPGEDAVVFLLTTNLATPAPLHRKCLIESVGGFRGDLPCAQEYDLHLRLACRGIRLRHLAEPLFDVRLLTESVSSNYGRVLEQVTRILNPIAEMLEAQNALAPARRRALSVVMARAARHQIRRGLCRKGLAQFRAARCMDEAGAWSVYRPSTRMLARLTGLASIETLVNLKRRIGRRHSYGGSVDPRETP